MTERRALWERPSSFFYSSRWFSCDRTRSTQVMGPPARGTPKLAMSKVSNVPQRCGIEGLVRRAKPDKLLFDRFESNAAGEYGGPDCARQ